MFWVWKFRVYFLIFIVIFLIFIIAFVFIVFIVLIRLVVFILYVFCVNLDILIVVFDNDITIVFRLLLSFLFALVNIIIILAIISGSLLT